MKEGDAPPLVSRLRASMEPIVSLTERQVSAIEGFRTALREGDYSFSPNPCLCGARDDVLIACRDRYGLEICTVLCHSCGLLRTDPYFDPESLLNFYRRHYRPIYTGEEFSPPSFFEEQRAHGEEIIRFLKTKGVCFPGRVLEVGCGAGGILEAFRREGARVAGCDPGKSFLEYGRKKGLALEAGGAENLNQYAPADLVILAHVLEHFRDPLAELRKIRHLLAPEGLLYVEVPGLFWIEKSYSGDFGRYLQNAHVYHFCLESLDYVLSLSGLSRQAGNEEVRAIYSYSNVSPLRPSHLAEKTLKYLNRLEQRRQSMIWQGRLFSPIRFLYQFCCLCSLSREAKASK